MNNITKLLFIVTSLFTVTFAGALLCFGIFMPPERTQPQQKNIAIKFKSMSQEELIENATSIMILDDKVSLDLRKVVTAILKVGVFYGIIISILSFCLIKKQSTTNGHEMG
jgi:hypothetical protein